LMVMPPLALQVHRVENLLPHELLVDGAGDIEKPVGERRFPVVMCATMQKFRIRC